MTEQAVLRQVLERIGHPRLLVLGDLILDQYTWGDAERVSPEAPVLILRVDTREVRLGGAASVAMLLRGLDAGVTLAGVVGDDPEGRTLQSLLKDERIDTSQLLIVDKDRPTTTKERFVGRAANRHPHQILRVDEESRDPIESKTEEWLATAIASRIPALGKERTCPMWKYQARDIATGREVHVPLCPELEDFEAVLISDYGKGVCTPRLVQTVIGFATERGVPVIIDPARISDFDRYRYATLLKPNRVEAELATGMTIRTPADALAAAAKLRQQLQVEAVLITLDRDGMVLVHADDVGQHFPTQPRAVYDITGAGDMVLAALGLCLASRLSLQESVQVANAAAGLEVEKLGVAPVSRRQLKRCALALLQDDVAATGVVRSCIPKSGSRIHPEILTTLSEAPAASAVLTALQPEKTIVFTNGCFRPAACRPCPTCLQEAATLGDVLDRRRQRRRQRSPVERGGPAGHQRTRQGGHGGGPRWRRSRPDLRRADAAQIVRSHSSRSVLAKGGIADRRNRRP